jgi:sec-independent protein translocase protein TatA
MGSFSLWHWLVVLAVVLLLFGGGGKISKILGDMGRGIKNFKHGLKEGEQGTDADAPQQATQIPNAQAAQAQPQKDEAVKT